MTRDLKHINTPEHGHANYHIKERSNAKNKT